MPEVVSPSYQVTKPLMPDVTPHVELPQQCLCKIASEQLIDTSPASTGRHIRHIKQALRDPLLDLCALISIIS